jgi:hypothetical protein
MDAWRFASRYLRRVPDVQQARQASKQAIRWAAAEHRMCMPACLPACAIYRPPEQQRSTANERPTDCPVRRSSSSLGAGPLCSVPLSRRPSERGWVRDGNVQYCSRRYLPPSASSWRTPTPEDGSSTEERRLSHPFRFLLEAWCRGMGLMACREVIPLEPREGRCYLTGR